MVGDEPGDGIATQRLGHPPLNCRLVKFEGIPRAESHDIEELSAAGSVDAPGGNQFIRVMHGHPWAGAESSVGQAV